MSIGPKVLLNVVSDVKSKDPEIRSPIFGLCPECVWSYTDSKVRQKNLQIFVFFSRSFKAISMFHQPLYLENNWKYYVSHVLLRHPQSELSLCFIVTRKPHPCSACLRVTAGTQGSQTTPPCTSSQTTEPFIQIWQGGRAIVFLYTKTNMDNNVIKWIHFNTDIQDNYHCFHSRNDF